MLSPSPTLLTSKRQPVAQQAAALIKQRIKRGIYPAGAQLPSIRALSSETGLSHRAVQRAIHQLEFEGVVRARQGSGVTVLEGADCRATALLFGFVQPYFTHFSLRLQNYLEDALDDRADLCVMKTSRNDAARERREIERLLEHGVNGLLVWPVEGDPNREFFREVAAQIPLVFVDRTLAGIGAPSVVLDYAECGREIATFLHQRGCRRVLMACDPANISTFNQLKAALREQAVQLDCPELITFFDYPIVRLVESYQDGDYELTDACYEEVASLLKRGAYDGLFCPQSEWLDRVFLESGRGAVLDGLQLAAMRVADGTRRSRLYYEREVEEWILDAGQMFALALELLQQMALNRRPRSRTIRVPIHRTV